MLQQLTVNPATEKYTHTQVVGLPVFAGTEITLATMNLLRMNRVKDQMSAALGITSDAGFYLTNNTQDILLQLDASIKAILDTDQPVKTAILTTIEVMTIEVIIASSRDGATQSITVSLYAGQSKLLSETRVKAINSFVASGTALLRLNGVTAA